MKKMTKATSKKTKGGKAVAVPLEGGRKLSVNEQLNLIAQQLNKIHNVDFDRFLNQCGYTNRTAPKHKSSPSASRISTKTKTVIK